jgi:hypothetical protein
LTFRIAEREILFLRSSDGVFLAGTHSKISDAIIVKNLWFIHSVLINCV